MKQSINLYQFRDAFQAIRPDNFSYEGLEVLFDWSESMDDDCGTETELDVIAICCEFSELEPREIRENYDTDLRGSELLEWLHERTSVCGETSDTIVYANF